MQVLVVELTEPNFSGDVMAELRRLGAADIVRLLDVLVVSRSADGSFDTHDLPGDADGSGGRIAAALLGCEEADATTTEVDGVSSWSLSDAVAPGTTVAVALIEHLWAAPLMAAIARAGGTPLDETWLAPDDLARLDALLTATA